MFALIKTANKSISRLYDVNYPMTITYGTSWQSKTKKYVVCVRKSLFIIVGKCHSATMTI